MWEKLQNIDVRILYLLLVLAIALPLLFPIGLPVAISDSTRGVYDLIESLPEGSYILLDAAYDPSGEAELYPQNLALARHCFQNNLRVIGFAQWQLGADLMLEALETAAEEYDKEYGKDWIHLGYKPGGTILLRGMIKDIYNSARADMHGTPLEQVPMMKEFQNLTDLNAIVAICAGSPGINEWITYVGTPSQNPGPNNADGFEHTVLIAEGTNSVSVPGAKARLQANLIVGLLEGGRGAAEYEILIDRPGEGVASMDAQSMGHLLIILFIVLGNIGYLATRKKS